MGKYNKYKRDKTIERKVLAKYGLSPEQFEDGGELDTTKGNENIIHPEVAEAQTPTETQTLMESQSKVNMNDISKYAGYAQVAGQGVNAISTDNPELARQNVQNTVDSVGNKIPFYQLGSGIDKMAFKRNTDGTYKSNIAAIASYQLNPAQNLGQSVKDAKKGNWGKAAVGLASPGASALFYQKDKKKEAKEQELDYLIANAQSPVRTNNPMENFNNQQLLNNINKQPMKCGGKLKRYKSGGEMYNEYNVGGAHEENPYGGIPIGVNTSGTQGLVEEKEISFTLPEKPDSTFIISNSIPYDKKYSIAEKLKKELKPLKFRKNDSFSKNTEKQLLTKYYNLQEDYKNKNGINNTTVAKYGGSIKFTPGGEWDTISKTAIPLVEGEPLPEGAEEITGSVRGVPQDFKVYRVNGKIHIWKPSNTPIRQQFNSAFDEARRAGKKIFSFQGKDYTTDLAGKGEEYYTERPKLIPMKVPEFKKIINPVEKPVEKLAPMYQYTNPTQDNQEYIPQEEGGNIRPDYLGTIMAAVPGLLGGLGNLWLSNKIKYDRISPEQIRSQQLDPIESVRRLLSNANATRESVKNSGVSTGAMLANQQVALAQAESAIASKYSEYDNTNVGILNNQQEQNVALREKAKYYNADIQRQELQDILGAKVKAFEEFTKGAGKAAEYLGEDVRFRQMEPLLSENYGLRESPESKWYSRRFESYIKNNPYAMKTQPVNQTVNSSTNRQLISGQPVNPYLTDINNMYEDNNMLVYNDNQYPKISKYGGYINKYRRY